MLNNKQKKVLQRLEVQLQSGQKTVKGTFDQKEPLTDKDKIRINKEIKTLKELQK